MKSILEVMLRLPSPVKVFVSTLALILARALTGPPRQTAGLQVYLLGADAMLLEKLEEAFAVIESTDPRWLRHLQTRVGRIAVTGAGVPEFRRFIRGIYIPASIVNGLTVEALSVLLVHEATHARIYDLGVRHRPERRKRIERACVAREIAFAVKIPIVGQTLAREAELRLQTEWWVPEVHAERMRRIVSEL